MDLGNAIALSTLVVTIGVLIVRYLPNRYIRKDEHDRVCAIIQKGVEDKFNMILTQIEDLKESIMYIVEAMRNGRK